MEAMVDQLTLAIDQRQPWARELLADLLTQTVEHINEPLKQFRALPDSDKCPREEQRGCAVCATTDLPKNSSCPQCDYIDYCSTTCQKLDWKLHKPLCKSLKDFKEVPQGYIRAILFPEEKRDPQWVFLKIKDTNHKEVDINAIRRELKAREMTDAKAVATAFVLRKNQALQRDIGTPIYCWFRGPQDTRTLCPVNQSIFKATNGLCLVQRGGPYLFHAGYGRDLNPRDYKHVVDWLTCNTPETCADWSGLQINQTPTGAGDDQENDAAPSAPAPPSAPFTRLGDDQSPGLRYHGVRINNKGDRALSNAGIYEQITAPACHPMFNVQASQILGVSLKLGLPLRIWALLPDPASWKSDDDLRNSEAADLIYSETSSDKARLWAGRLPWSGQIRSVVLFREDGKALRTQDVEALCAFLEVGTNGWASAMANREVPTLEETMAGGFETSGLKQEFLEFFKTYSEKRASVEKWKGVVSPYDL
ncbi:hypothetical protein NA57DRAFT_54238 [Rhizodiscina lignyota]|uniref:MYND-type domain-containing protein n=1 Tax=Rhizodiscina lignyota TaxID=1504668 RepID=A0A9P4IM70_9PEZI|nr:hypothetical protein NA57DRAFT_54238 [Rhizodiscina lignyota]